MFQKYLTVVLDEFGEASEIFIKIPFLRIVAPHLLKHEVSELSITESLEHEIEPNQQQIRFIAKVCKLNFIQ
jgi:hypothetical protein